MEQCARVSPTRTRTVRVGPDEFEISKKIPKWNAYVRRNLKWPWSPVTPPILQERARTVQLIIWPSTFGQLNGPTVELYSRVVILMHQICQLGQTIPALISKHSLCNVRHGCWIKSADPDTVWVWCLNRSRLNHNHTNDFTIYNKIFNWEHVR